MINIVVCGLPVMGPDKSTKLEADILMAFNAVKKRQKLDVARPMLSFTPESPRNGLGADICALVFGAPEEGSPNLGPVESDLATEIGEVISRRFPKSRVWCKVLDEKCEKGAWSSEKIKPKPKAGEPEHIRDT